ncbi:hypothetical protein Tco_0842004 [Tanacetum coccineum]|uniref:Uncharacterized protein n=1 Tax=Tanacetum coccineum TaxID=301880 RepID=A0ABQ5B1H6_9ASTR
MGLEGVGVNQLARKKGWVTWSESGLPFPKVLLKLMYEFLQRRRRSEFEVLLPLLNNILPLGFLALVICTESSLETGGFQGLEIAMSVMSAAPASATLFSLRVCNSLLRNHIREASLTFMLFWQTVLRCLSSEELCGRRRPKTSYDAELSNSPSMVSETPSCGCLVELLGSDGSLLLDRSWKIWLSRVTRPVIRRPEATEFLRISELRELGVTGTARGSPRMTHCFLLTVKDSWGMEKSARIEFTSWHQATSIIGSRYGFTYIEPYTAS